MTEHWERSVVAGYGSRDEEKWDAKEVVLHRRGEDPVVMACRRNNLLAGCASISVSTEEVFTQIRKDEGRKDAREIPRDRTPMEAWDW